MVDTPLYHIVRVAVAAEVSRMRTLQERHKRQEFFQGNEKLVDEMPPYLMKTMTGLPYQFTISHSKSY